VTKEKVITMNDEQFRKIKLNRTLYSAKKIGSSEPEYFLDYKITTVRYLPTDEHYDIVREMFEICVNDPDNVVNWYNEKLIKILEYDLKIQDENNADKDSTGYERIQKCRDDTLRFFVKRGRVIPQNILTEKQPEKESGGESKNLNYLSFWGLEIVKILMKLKEGEGVAHATLKGKLDDVETSKIPPSYRKHLSDIFKTPKAKLFYKDEILNTKEGWKLKNRSKFNL